ncbi:MAG TPA: D-mannonate oxidoreductase, partial [Prevotellaceae bacterium]|nr:D-mannonate oxidoreductase [Prevotellaceae bacterium]
MSLFDIKGQVVVITGGTGILGREIGAYLAHEGAQVVLLGRRKNVGETIVQNIRDNGGKAAFMTCDVTDVDAVAQVRDNIVSQYGQVDTLLNAAGGNMPGATIPPGKTLFDVSVEEFQRVLNVNLTGTLI